MCGIVGYTGSNEATPFLLEGLRTLEYRGYDSAGVEVLSPDGALHGVKCAGRVAALADRGLRGRALLLPVSVENLPRGGTRRASQVYNK